jgi:REP element-mobilizing transposase RayT
VFNRGNSRRDLFENVGAAGAFLQTLFECAGKFTWRVHAYVLMRNHFHWAIETPEPSLGEDMHRKLEAATMHKV